MNAGVDLFLALAGVAMLVLALLVPCAGGAVIAIRLGAEHAAALAVAALAQAMTKGQPVLLMLTALVLAKAIALPWLLPGDVRTQEPGRPLPVLAAGTALAALAWMALPPVAGLRPMAVPLALAMLSLGILPAALGQGAARRFLGLLVAANGAMLAALEAADPARLVLLELGVLVLLGALLVAMRWERDAPRAMP